MTNIVINGHQTTPLSNSCFLKYITYSKLISGTLCQNLELSINETRKVTYDPSAQIILDWLIDFFSSVGHHNIANLKIILVHYIINNIRWYITSIIPTHKKRGAYPCIMFDNNNNISWCPPKVHDPARDLPASRGVASHEHIGERSK